MKRIKAFVMAALLVCGLLTGCGSNSGTAASSSASASSSAGGKTITYALGATWGSLVPYTYSSSYSSCVQGMIYDHLVRINEAGEVEPRAAESWEVSDDGMTYTFHLHKDAMWSDGTPCTAKDWVFAAEFMTDPAVVAPQKGYMAVLTGVDASGNRDDSEPFGMTAPDDYTLVLKLDSPSFIEAFLGNANPYIQALPEHLLSNMDKANWSEDPFWQNPVTNGPFRVSGGVAGQELTLTADPDYYMDLSFDTLIFKVLDSSNFATAIMAGEVDAAYPYVTPDEAQTLQSMDGIVVTKNEQDTSLMFMTINTQKYPKAVRQAMALAIDKDLIVSQLILGEGEATCNLMMSASPYYNDTLEPKQDLEKAKELLTEAGWNSSTVVTMGVPSGIREKIAALIQQDFAKVGIKLEISVMDTTTLFSGLRDGSIDCGLATWTHTPGNPLFFATQLDPSTVNFACVKDDTYMDLINQAQAEQDTNKRIELIKELEAQVADECAYVPLYQEFTFVITSPRVDGITAINTEAPWEWTVK